jgi:hypothetical protein
MCSYCCHRAALTEHSTQLQSAALDFAASHAEHYLTVAMAMITEGFVASILIALGVIHSLVVELGGRPSEDWLAIPSRSVTLFVQTAVSIRCQSSVSWLSLTICLQIEGSVCRGHTLLF